MWLCDSVLCGCVVVCCCGCVLLRLCVVWLCVAAVECLSAHVGGVWDASPVSTRGGRWAGVRLQTGHGHS